MQTRPRLSNEIVDTRLGNRPLKRLGEYKNTLIPIKWKCLDLNCEYIWDATPKNVIHAKHPTGCPKCAGNQPFDNQIIDCLLVSKNIERLDDYTRSITPIRFRCLKCNYIWKTKPGHIINENSGCPVCNTPGLNEKLMIETIFQSQIEYILQLNLKIFDKENPPYKLDMFISSIKLAIEYNGEQHYRPARFGNNYLKDPREPQERFVKQQARDNYVRQFCIDNHIELIEIDGRKLKNKKLVAYLNNELIPYIKSKTN